MERVLPMARDWSPRVHDEAASLGGLATRPQAAGIHRDAAPRALVRFKPATPARLRLICLPYAGGNAVAFHRWGACLPDDVELWSAQYRGRGYRFHETPFVHMSDMLDELEAAIAPLLDVPTVLFGHSMGAVLAFELTRRMMAKSAALPTHLFLSGRSAPRQGDAVAPVVVPDWSDAQLIQSLHALAGTPGQVLADPGLREHALLTLRADLTCLQGWRTRAEPALPVPITVFGGSDDPHAPAHSLDGWAQGTTQAFGKHVFQGGHFFIRDAYPGMIDLMLRTVRP
ncbi:MAG: thioesterase [Rubrivivax sp.]|nr:MAG: thioesterase [Rubrivivax sp.]